MLESENHTPITNGYAMNAPRRTTVGVRRAKARSLSFSRRRSNARRRRTAPECGSATSTRAALPAPPAIGFFKRSTCRSAFVDLLQLAFGPLHRVLGLHALHGLGVHVDDDVLRVGLGGLAGGRARMAEGERLARGLTEHLQLLVDAAPHRMLFPLLGGAHAVALVDLEPLAVVRVLVEPLQEVLRQLDVLRILHDRVLLATIERELPGRPRRPER